MPLCLLIRKARKPLAQNHNKKPHTRCISEVWMGLRCGALRLLPGQGIIFLGGWEDGEIGISRWDGCSSNFLSVFGPLSRFLGCDTKHNKNRKSKSGRWHDVRGKSFSCRRYHFRNSARVSPISQAPLPWETVPITYRKVVPVTPSIWGPKSTWRSRKRGKD